jgi:hypothetical protein
VPFEAYHQQVQHQDPDHADKMFVAVLLLLKQYPVTVVAESLNKALEQNQVNIELIRNYADSLICYKKSVTPAEATIVPASTQTPVAPPVLSRYLQLHEGGVSA